MSVYSDIDPLPSNSAVIQLGQRDWEMGKNYPAEIAIRCGLKQTIPLLASHIEGRIDRDAAAARNNALQAQNWSSRRNEIVAELEMSGTNTPVDPDCLMARISDRLPDDGVWVDESLVSGRQIANLFAYQDPDSFFGLASGGIGFAIAGAVGISLGLPSRRIVATIGDGSAMYSIQALWTAAHHELPITYVICNNGGYRIIKERLFAFHRNNHFIGMDFEKPTLDFVKIAEGLGVPAKRIATLDEFDAALTESLNTRGPQLLDVQVDRGDLG